MSAFAVLKQTERGDCLREERARLGSEPELFPWALAAGGALPVALTRDERERWKEIYGEMIADPRSGIEAALLNRRFYVNAPDAEKRTLLHGALARYRERAKLQFLAEDKRLALRALYNTEESYHAYFPCAPEEKS